MVLRSTPDMYGRRFTQEPTDAHRASQNAPTPNALPTFTDLLVRTFPRAWRVARRMGLDAGVAEEVAQEAFVVFLQKHQQIELGKEDAFLLSTTARLCQNLRRKSFRLQEQLLAPDELEQHAASVSTQRLLEQKQARELFDEMLSRMSEPLRIVFVLHELEQLTLQEISEALEIPAGTAASRLRLARVAFDQELSQFRHNDLPSSEEP